MAKKTKVILVDDTDGSLAAETVQFSLDGVNYQIDLSQENAAEFRKSLQPWIEKSRRVRRRRAPRKSTVNTVEVRKWARENGFKISDRGRISREILDAYLKSH